MLDIAKVTQKERPKVIENDLNKNTKTIEAIQQDNLEFDYESQNKLQSLIEMLQNLKDRIFNNTENELENRLI